jgi:hypothetical protein
MLFNLTYTFWPGLAILGLVGLRASYQNNCLSLTDMLVCIPGLTGSPLGVLFFPLFAWVAYTKKSWRAATIAAATLLSYIFLVERDGRRSNLEDMLLRSAESISQAVSGQIEYLINTSSPGSLVMSVLGVLSVLLVISLGIYWIVRKRWDQASVLFYMLGSLATVVAAAGSVDLPLSARYWFPIVICATVLLGRFFIAPALSGGRNIVEPVLVVSLCICMLGASALRVHSWGGVSYAIQEWSKMVVHPDHLIGLQRSWHSDPSWAIGLGEGSIPYEECAGLWEHPSALESYGFRVYCGNGVF